MILLYDLIDSDMFRSVFSFLTHVKFFFSTFTDPYLNFPSHRLTFILYEIVVRKSAFSSGTRQQPNSLLIGDTTGTTSALVISSTEGGGGALVPITSSIESKVEAGDSLIADMAPSGACLHGHEDRYFQCHVFAMLGC